MKRHCKTQGTVMAALLLWVCLAPGFSTTALAQTLSWAQRAGGTNGDGGRGIAVDSAGNSYVVGYTGNSNSFFAKYNPGGTQLWAKQAPAYRPSWVGVAVDATGAGIYVT